MDEVTLALFHTVLALSKYVLEPGNHAARKELESLVENAGPIENSLKFLVNHCQKNELEIAELKNTMLKLKGKL